MRPFPMLVMSMAVNNSAFNDQASDRRIGVWHQSCSRIFLWATVCELGFAAQKLQRL